MGNDRLKCKSFKSHQFYNCLLIVIAKGKCSDYCTKYLNRSRMSFYRYIFFINLGLHEFWAISRFIIKEGQPRRLFRNLKDKDGQILSDYKIIIKEVFLFGAVENRRIFQSCTLSIWNFFLLSLQYLLYI